MMEGSKQKGSNYPADEDLALCRAWIVISEDQVLTRGIESKINFYNFTMRARK